MALIATATTPYTQEEPPKTVAKTISGAVFPESVYLEPTIGQIWPR